MISRERTNEARDDPHIIEANIDPDSTADGYRYAQSLAQFLDRRDPDGNDVVIWTSSLQRAMQTASAARSHGLGVARPRCREKRALPRPDFASHSCRVPSASSLRYSTRCLG
jgi:broad specificity phosphatase PhoE